MHNSLCLNLTGSEVYTWGRKDYGQLGHSEAKGDFGEYTSTSTLVKFPALEGSKVHLFTDIACGDHTSMALTVDHDLYTWGFDSTTGHGGRFNKEDLLRRRKLIINDRLQPKGDASTAEVYEVSCGGQHSALLVKRFAGSGN
jgi:alpha-tubulin suppressor-like RCC1 family protein